MSNASSHWQIISVDASASSAAMLESVLAEVSFLGKPIKITQTTSLEEATTIIQQGYSSIAVILLDSMISTQDKVLEFIKRIKDDAISSQIRVIIRTGYPDALPAKKDIQNYEIDGYISKEISSEAQIIISVMTAIRAYNKIKATEKALSALAGSIAHECRNPLNKISLTAENALEKLHKNNAIDKAVIHDWQLVQDITHNSSNMISMLLSNMRNREIDTSKFVPLSITECTEQALKLYAFQQGEREKVSLNIEEDFAFLGSTALFQCLLFNLLKNALYYLSEKPQTTISITVKLGKLYFKDTGIGIPEDKVRLLFKDFMTSNKVGGTGLGLSFCKRAMQSFGGSILCSSKLGEYTEFELSFPEKNIDTQLVEHKKKAIKEVNYELFCGQKILFIEDENIAITMLTHLLKDINLNITFAVDGIEGVELAKKLSPKIIFTDLNLPKLKGDALVNQLHALPYKPVIISISGDQPDKEMEAKLDDFLVKPILKQALLEKLSMYLQ